MGDLILAASRANTDIVPKPHPDLPEPGLLRLVLVGAVALISLGAFENLAVTTVMPVVARELDGLRLYALALGLPLAAHIAATAAAGIWVDARSLRGPLIWGVALFAAGLVVAGSAQGMTVVALGRGISGIGTGFVTVALYAAVGTIAPSDQRPRFFAAFSAAWVVPSLVGPPLAGYLAQVVTWRIVFLGVVPLAVAALALLRPLLATAAPAVERPAIRRRLRSTLAPAVLVAAAVAVLQAASHIVVALLALGVILALLPRLLPPGTFRLRPGIAAVVATRLLINGAVIGMEAFLPLLLQRERAWSPGAAGIVLTVGSVTWALGSWAQGRITDPATRHRAALTGAVLVAVGTGTSSLVAFDETPAFLALAGWVFAGLGMGIVFPAMAVLALATTPPENHGEVSAALQIADGVGAALALAAVGAGFTWLLETGANPYLPGFAALIVVAAVAIVATARVPNLTRSARPGTAG